MSVANTQAVAEETGYPVHEVLSRGISFCRRNPRGPADRSGFDQSLPEGSDLVGLARTARANLPSGLVDRDLEAEAGIVSYNCEEVSRRVRHAFEQSREAVRGRSIPVYLRHEAGKGGTFIVGRLGDRDLFETTVLCDEDLLTVEPLCRDLLHALAVQLPHLAA